MLSRCILRSVSRQTCFQIACIGQGSRTSEHTMWPQTFEERVFFPNGTKHFSAMQGCSNGDRQGSQRRSSKIDDEYEEAVKALNTLMSNADTLKRSIAAYSKRPPEDLSDMRKYMARSGLSLEELEKRSFIHVAGTKGKGTTCALTESILRTHGAKTGFFSSPHLISVTERIRINGQPISKEKFSRAFWKVFKSLEALKQHSDDMPAYFKFLTILCFHIFLEEKTDVNILEVGIGGELDCTNVIRNTKTVGIASLGLEHTQLLGDTLEKIAWQKAGIIKPNSNVYTSATQPECLDVIRQRAAEKKATAVHIVPKFSEYFQDPKFRDLLPQIHNVTTKLNASLAIQLAYDWLRNNKNGLHQNYALNTAQLTDKVVEGLTKTLWPGRCQLVKFLNFNLHLDGAHTVESISICADWFRSSVENSAKPKVLIFNATGGRDAKTLLSILRHNINFDLVCFVPNIPTGKNSKKDNISVYGETDQLKRTKVHQAEWQELCKETGKEDTTSHMFRSVLESFNYAQNCFGENQRLDVLVTGSVHLIGATIEALNDFEMCLQESERFIS